MHSRVMRCLLACTLIAGCASAAPPVPAERAVELAPGVYMFSGTGGAADEHNLGRIGNGGFIVGEHGVIVVDPGASHAHGQARLAAIREVTAQPVRVVLVTHARPDFLFGGAAFRERGIPVRMHSRTARLMASRCETCLKTLRQTVGDAAMRGTVMYQADQEFDTNHALDLIGRPVRILSFGHSSGPGDSAVFDERSGVLFAGGLLDARRVPDIQDSDLEGWIKALSELRALRPRVIVPGHGVASSITLTSIVARYLEQLQAHVRALLLSGTSLLHIAEAGELPEYESWDQYDIIHRRNAAVAFLRYERELIFK